MPVKELIKEEEILKAEKSIEWLQKQKKDLTNLIEKRVVVQKTDNQETIMKSVRVAIITAICFLVFGLIAKFTGFFDEKVFLRFILVVVVPTFIIVQIYLKFQGRKIGSEASRITKVKAKKAEVMKKYTTEEETQRFRIINEKIEEIKNQIKELKGVSKFNTLQAEDEVLDLPDITLNTKL